MKTFLLKLIGFILLQGTLLGVVWYSYFQKPSIQQGYHAALIDKHNLLTAQTKPRIIFIGGSSLAFGLDSAAVAEGCGYHPVNMGVSIGFGLAFMLREVEPDLERGDVVVILPEYQLFDEKGLAGEPETLWRSLEVRPANFRYLAPKQLAQMFDEGLAHRLGGILRSELATPKALLTGTAIAPDAIYQRKSFNRSGDIVAHYGLPPGEAAPSKFGFVFRRDLVAEAIDALNEFGRGCSRRGVRVFFSHSPLHESAYALRKNALADLEAALRGGLQIPILDAPEEMVFPHDQFFDNYSHLSRAGVQQRTRLLHERLRKHLQPPRTEKEITPKI